MEEIDVQNCADEFESLARANGFRFWLASDLMRLLGYLDAKSFNKAINRAIATCATLNIPIDENFKRITAPGAADDYKLTRFACYLTAMNGDVRKPQVAAAQTYFALIAEHFRQYIQEAEGVERVVLRSEVTEREKSLSGVAHKAGVEHYPFFQNAGYRGMYNMCISDLKKRKGLPEGKALLDHMGKVELAANLFRITQTEAKIINEAISGQKKLESAATTVGQKVRETMIELSGTPPEDLPLAPNIKEIHTEIKQTQRRLAEMDKG